jgi:DNA polymerase iota
LYKEDPSAGFPFDATQLAGNAFDRYDNEVSAPEKLAADLQHLGKSSLNLRLHLASHLAQHVRMKLENEKGYTCTLGISTSKLLSKLVGNQNKPRSQTTLMPPYVAPTACMSSSEQQSIEPRPSNVQLFLDTHEVGKLPGIGFKTASKLRELVHHGPVDVVDWIPQKTVSVHDVRTFPGAGPSLLEKTLAGPGSLHGTGTTIWNLLHGIDETEVALHRDVPRQISIEDSYGKITTIPEVLEQLELLSASLIRRMRVDLVERRPDGTQKWLAFPRTLRLSTRPRLVDKTVDGTMVRLSTGRISRSMPSPGFLNSLGEDVELLANKLVVDCLLTMFKKLHPEKSGWNLSLINVAVTNMAETAGDGPTAAGRDISSMFKNQDATLKEWRISDQDVPPDIAMEDAMEDAMVVGIHTSSILEGRNAAGSEDLPTGSQQQRLWQDLPDDWNLGEEDTFLGNLRCIICGAFMPSFALAAHERYHQIEDSS